MGVAEERLRLAREALIADGYFTADQVGDDIAPRIVERLAAAEGSGVAVRRILRVFDDDPQMTEDLFADPGQRTAEQAALVKIREIARKVLEGRARRYGDSIIRPWVVEGDYTEIIVPAKGYLAVRELTEAEQVAAALRYIAARFGLDDPQP